MFLLIVKNFFGRLHMHSGFSWMGLALLLTSSCKTCSSAKIWRRDAMTFLRLNAEERKQHALRLPSPAYQNLAFWGDTKM